MQNEQVVMKIGQVADYLQLNQRTVRMMIKGGVLPVLKGCRDFRIRRSDVESLFAPVDSMKETISNRKRGGKND